MQHPEITEQVPFKHIFYDSVIYDSTVIGIFFLLTLDMFQHMSICSLNYRNRKFYKGPLYDLRAHLRINKPSECYSMNVSGIRPFQSLVRLLYCFLITWDSMALLFSLQ